MTSWPVAAAIGITLLALLLGGLRAMRWWRMNRNADVPLAFPVEPPPLTPWWVDLSPSPPSEPPPSSRPPEVEAELYEGKTIRYYRPPAKTLQLIPGRLEVITGEDRSEMIRFVRTPGSAPEVTLGRGEGAPLRHIQFRAATVSRQHARMSYLNSHWVISNLSRINPVVINGVELVPPVNEHVLVDGDEIELGEIVFRFHSR